MNIPRFGVLVWAFVVTTFYFFTFVPLIFPKIPQLWNLRSMPSWLMLSILAICSIWLLHWLHEFMKYSDLKAYWVVMTYFCGAAIGATQAANAIFLYSWQSDKSLYVTTYIVGIFYGVLVMSPVAGYLLSVLLVQIRMIRILISNDYVLIKCEEKEWHIKDQAGNYFKLIQPVDGKLAFGSESDSLWFYTQYPAIECAKRYGMNFIVE